MFDIAIDPTSSADLDVIRGAIRLNDYDEHFQVSLGYWSQGDYQKQWQEGIRRILESHADSCLITSITDPRTSNFLIWWPIYIDGSDVVFQNQILFLEECDPKFDPRNPYLSLSPWISVNQGGQKISEWRVPARTLEDWHQTQRAELCRVAPSLGEPTEHILTVGLAKARRHPTRFVNGRVR